MNKNFDILCQGSLCTEVLAWVERYPGAGDGIIADSIKWTGGGMAANAASAIALLVGRVTLLSTTGDDYYGHESLKKLRENGVNIDFLVQRRNHSSPIVILMIDPSLKRAGLVLPMERDLELKIEDVPDEVFQTNKVFFTDMHPLETSVELTRKAKRFGLVIAMDMQMTEAHTNLPGLNEKITEMFDMTDYFFADEENFLNWTGYSRIEPACKTLFDLYPNKILVITRGKEGSWIITNQRAIEIPIFQVPVVDSIGAGDAYHGAFLYAHLVLNMSLHDAGLFASATAALSCMKSGARDGLPDFKTVQNFLETRSN